jgi:crotonobetainyl-CoA:carnitine CoA-transferase CaiB-like acyl-CoA transferase
MSVNGYPEGNPLRVGVPIVDIVAANLAFSGVLLAVLDRTRTGNGQLVDIALLDAVISILHPHAANWTVSGVVPERTGELHPPVVPYQVFATGDGDFFISAANDRQFASLAAVLGIPEIITDPRFVANRDRHKHREELIALIAPLIATWRREELGALLTEAGVPCSPVNTVAQALQSPQVRHRELFVERDGYRGIGVPISLGNAKTAAQTPAVKCGAHTVEVLAAMGYDAESIDTLA